MKLFYRHRRSLLVSSSLFIFCLILTKCIDKAKEAGKNDESPVPAVPVADTRQIRFGQFAGSASCQNCHKDIYDKHLRTGHHLSSQPASEKSIKGSFKNGKNEYDYSPDVKVRMVKRDSGLFQAVYHKGEEKRTLRFELVTGSGAKGQSFVYSHGKRFFQMPITYYSDANQWSNSPGFPDKIMMDRPITARCLECHTTYAETISPPGKEPEEFDKDKILFGVDCERCHGPAKEHIAFHNANPNAGRGRHIVNTGSLSRQQQLDLCAFCHGGAMSKTKPSFQFLPGDTLSEYFVLRHLENATPNYDNIDVHGNQYGLLAASKCFTSSQMTCNSCHSSHENERGKLSVFSNRCQSCHNPDHGKICKMTESIGPSIKQNCIDCHMPSIRSKAITLMLPGQEVPSAAYVRSHFISIYPDAVKNFIKGKN